MWKTRSSSPPSLPRSNCALRAAAFTLVELLVAVTVLALIVVLFAQVIAGTSASIQGSSNGMSLDQAGAIALDKIGNTLRSMVTTGSGTLVVIKNAGGTTGNASDGLAMIANQRVRNRSGGTYPNINVTASTNIRMGAFGYCVVNTITSNSASAPVLNWGDGTIYFPPPTGTASSTSDVPGDPSLALQNAATDVANEIAGSTSAATPMLQFSPLNPSILRFEVCCLLSDGTIASGITGSNGKPLTLLSGYSGNTLLPRNKYFVTGEALATPAVSFQSPQYPLAFNTSDSDVAPDTTSNSQNVYVRAIIVGIASLDTNTQKLLSSSQVQALSGSAVFAKADGQTPLATWDISSTTSATATANRTKLSPSGPSQFPAAVLRNIHLYQRYYYVN